MKHIINNTNQGEVAPWVTLDEDGVHYSGNVVIEEDPYEYVDLGLPSGTLWATCNIGANKPEEYGLYFQWGATQGYAGDDANAHSTWSTAPFNNGAYSYDEAYFASVKDTVCPNAVLTLEYDAAHVHMGGNWRMPTIADTDELVENTANNWITNYNNSGINGYLFASKINGNILFIPAASDCINGSFYNVGYNGSVWTSNLSDSYQNCAYFLRFTDGYASPQYINQRCEGRSVRGVKNPS